jgi:flagellar biosynthetic protein FliP
MALEQLWNMAGPLLVVLCALLGARALVLRSGLASSLASGRRIRVIESQVLGPKSRIHLVDVEGQRLLVGSGEQGVTLLADRGPSTAHAEERAPESGPAPARPKQVDIGAAVRALLVVGMVVLSPLAAFAEAATGTGGVTLAVPESISIDGRSSALDMLGLLTILAVAPSILLMSTCFTRFVIVLAFVRQAIGVQHMPPNQVLIGLALFLTAFVMAPIADEVVTVAYDPYVAGELSAREALDNAVDPMRRFMLSQTREDDLALFAELSKTGPVEDLDQLPLTTLLPSFLVSELRTAFEIGFVIFLPFLIIDLVVSSLLISMGMIVLPPIVVSLPFKIMLFVLVDGWNLILGSLVQGLL